MEETPQPFSLPRIGRKYEGERNKTIALLRAPCQQVYRKEAIIMQSAEDEKQIEKQDVDPNFCIKFCAAGRVKGRCLASSEYCSHPKPKLKSIPSS